MTPPNATSQGKKALIVVNLGSPDSTEISDVRAYLREFLMDPDVIQIPRFLRFLLVYFVISIFRASKSAEAYKSIWDSERGSPLKYITKDFTAKLCEELKTHRDSSNDSWWKGEPVHITWCMRYGKPSVKLTLAALKAQGYENIRILPMYPQFADSSYVSVVREFNKWSKKLKFKCIKVYKPFFAEAFYLKSLEKSLRIQIQDLSKPTFLFSYHGLPASHIEKKGPGCLQQDCCLQPGEALSKCYRAQSFYITKFLSRELGLRDEKVVTAFQSRLTNGWIEPYTDKVVEKLGQEGEEDLVIVSPSFTVDCLETIEEIGIQYKEQFEKAGGGKFRWVPCLNSEPFWVESTASALLSTTWGQELVSLDQVLENINMKA